MWSKICIPNFIPASFFNEWLDKQKSVAGAQIVPKA